MILETTPKCSLKRPVLHFYTDPEKEGEIAANVALEVALSAVLALSFGIIIT